MLRLPETKLQSYSLFNWYHSLLEIISLFIFVLCLSIFLCLLFFILQENYILDIINMHEGEKNGTDPIDIDRQRQKRCTTNYKMCVLRLLSNAKWTTIAERNEQVCSR